MERGDPGGGVRGQPVQPLHLSDSRDRGQLHSRHRPLLQHQVQLRSSREFNLARHPTARHNLKPGASLLRFRAGWCGGNVEVAAGGDRFLPKKGMSAMAAMKQKPLVLSITWATLSRRPTPHRNDIECSHRWHHHVLGSVVLPHVVRFRTSKNTRPIKTIIPPS